MQLVRTDGLELYRGMDAEKRYRWTAEAPPDGMSIGATQDLKWTGYEPGPACHEADAWRPLRAEPSPLWDTSGRFVVVKNEKNQPLAAVDLAAVASITIEPSDSLVYRAVNGAVIFELVRFTSRLKDWDQILQNQLNAWEAARRQATADPGQKRASPSKQLLMVMPADDQVN